MTLPVGSGNPDVNAILMLSLAQMAQSQMQFLQKLPGSMGSVAPSGPHIEPSVARLNAPIMPADENSTRDLAKPWITYPRFDQFFQSLTDTDGRDTDTILAKLSDAAIYHIDEISTFSDSELKEEGLMMSDIKWLRKEVKRVMKSFDCDY